MPLSLKKTAILLLIVAQMSISCSARNQRAEPSDGGAQLVLELKVPTYRFVAFGDTRFHDPSDSEPANPAIRHALVAAIDKEKPAFVSIGGDIVYNGEDTNDWKVWDSETAVWRQDRIRVFPALGNHDLKGSQQTALKNYFQRFPELDGNRYYSVSMGNALMLVLDSSLAEISGPQGEWMRMQLDRLPGPTDFVFFVFHHPPYTSSSDEKVFGGGHSARASEQALGKLLEEYQQRTRARFVVFNGHVHNYERHEHGGVIYFVTGGGGAHPYPITRKPDDLYKDGGVNYHYLLAEVDHNRLTIAMHKVEIKDGKEIWSQPDSVTIAAPVTVPATAR
jgi:hypothetical protein